MRAVHADEEHGEARVIAPPWPDLPPNTEAECVEFEDEVPAGAGPQRSSIRSVLVRLAEGRSASGRFQ